MAEEPSKDAPPPPPQPKEKENIPKPKMASAPGSTAPNRSVSACIAITLLVVGAIILTYWLIYRPHKPHFTVTNAAIYDLNTTSAPFLSTSMQFTIITRNPNERDSIYYDKLTAYVSYRNQQITPLIELPPLFHERKSAVALSPVLSGGGVPVSTEVLSGLAMDEAYGVVPLRVVLMGRLRWKAGIIRTAKYAVYVKCDVWVGLKKGVVGQVPLLGAPPCKVDI